MSSKLRKMVKQKALAMGYGPMDIARMERVAKKESDKMYADAERNAFLKSLAIPLQLLATDYWSKTASKRIPEFLENVLSLYDSLGAGIVTYEEVFQVLEDLTGKEYSKIVKRETRDICNMSPKVEQQF